MHIYIIEGDSTDKIRRACYDYLREKYRREKPNDSSIRESEKIKQKEDDTSKVSPS